MTSLTCNHQTDNLWSSAERKQRLEKEVARYVRLLTEHGDPERVIVFGSLATDQVHAWSDIDLVIIQRTDFVFSTPASNAALAPASGRH